MSTPIFCERCGIALASDSSFCTSCGASVAPTRLAPAPTRKHLAESQPLSHGTARQQTRPVGIIIAIVSAVTATLIGVLVWNQMKPQTLKSSEQPASSQPNEVATTSSTTTTSSSTTTSTTTTIPQQPQGIAPRDLWISDTPMAQPECDGRYITIIASTSGERAVQSSSDYPDGNYLRTDITCPSLNPFFSSGSLQGQPIYLVYFGPFFNRYDAQQKCLDLGIRKKSNCYVAPLTENSSDRTVRYGPLDS
jgi:hypothetical protein